MIGPRSYRRVKIELDVKQDDDGNWVGRYQLTWQAGSTESFFTKRACATKELAKDSARDEANYYIDQRKGPIKSQ